MIAHVSKIRNASHLSEILTISSIFIFSVIYTNDIFSQPIVCVWCDGSGKEKEWLDEYVCQNCVYWNESYRSKVPCHICRDTRRTPNRRYRIVACTNCNGTGRDYKQERRNIEQERRNIEFGGRDHIPSTNSTVIVNGLTVQMGRWRERLGTDDPKLIGYKNVIKINYHTAEKLCQSLGAGWRLPTSVELNYLLNEHIKGNTDLGFEINEFYWTTTNDDYEGKKRVLSIYIFKENKEAGIKGGKEITRISYTTESGYWEKKAGCKCVKGSQSQTVYKKESLMTSSNTSKSDMSDFNQPSSKISLPAPTNNLRSNIPSYLPKNGLIAYLGFDGNSYDYSGGENHGIIKGASLTNDRFGNPNSAYSFNGITNNIELKSITNGINEFTISMWIKPSNWESYSSVGKYFFSANKANGDIIDFGKHPEKGNSLIFGIYENGWNWVDSKFVPQNNQYYHVVATWSEEGEKLYINGNYVGSNTYNSKPKEIPTKITIGSSSYSESFFEGCIDDISIWQRALNEGEINRLFIASK